MTALSAKQRALLWLALTVAVGAWAAYAIYGTSPQQKALLLPGPTSHGHYQIELACAACHTEAFGNEASLTQACENCHNEELKRAHDSHPKSKFTDPRNAARVEVLDARSCITCHKEHQPEQTHAMGLTLPEDYCVRCHEDVAKERPTHQGLGFETCATAGCHNFHDNTALYEDFLLEHAGDPSTPTAPAMPARTPPAQSPRAAPDAPPALALSDAELLGWSESPHARSPVNCSSCHADKGGEFKKEVTYARCRGCHEREVDGWLSSHHGMRQQQGLSPMMPKMARLPMKAAASEQHLNCSSCHAAHTYDTRHAAYDACVGCHDDEHTRNYPKSAHFQTFQRSLETGDSTSAVSCATCHLPRTKEGDSVAVSHNPNDNLRPNEKMLRPVCMNCHSLQFSLDALADPQLVRGNFQGPPSIHIASIEMAVSRDNEQKKQGASK